MKSPYNEAKFFQRPTAMSAAFERGRILHVAPFVFKREPRKMIVRADGRREVL